MFAPGAATIHGMAVTDEAILRIKEMIVSGDLAPGDRLPPEKELSERLGLSRSSLREAVKALEVIRILDVRRGDGTYVTSLEPELLLEALSFVVDLHDDESVLETFAVRRILEPAAAALAARRAGAETAARLRQFLAKTSEQNDVTALVTHDIEFHHTIAQASGNRYLTGLIESMSSRTIRARVWRGITQDGAANRTIAEHATIANALAEGDSELVAALMFTHIAGIETWLRTAATHASSLTFTNRQTPTPARENWTL